MHLTSSPPPPNADADNFYPTGDGRPMAETPVHRQNLTNSIEVLGLWFADDPLAYVSGNMFIYYEPGNRLKHVSPDVFVALGVPKDKERKAYYVWEEGRAPDLVIELTSASTRGEDTGGKKSLYQDVLVVPEYILFDPYGEYLKPALQGFRLREGKYVEIPQVGGRLPSEVLGLHFEGHGKELRLYDPTTGRWLPTLLELQAQTEAKLGETDAQLRQTAAERDRATAEAERLEKELAELRQRLGQSET
ncbi:MAG TPA: Uma2 family endonuclease [Pirellulales bacterium]|nr:Uma2 family endonuclease [Pirellulales bacterium]